MEFSAEHHGNVAVVLLPGESLDSATAREFRKSIEPILQKSSKVVFDMSGLRFVDSSGLGVLLSCLRVLNVGGGDLKLCNMSNSVRALIELVRMHRIFDIYPSKEDAIHAFSAK